MASGSQFGSSTEPGANWNQFSQYDPSNQMQLQFSQEFFPATDSYRYHFTIEELAADPAISGAALCYYQAERMSSLQSKYSNKTLEELVTMAIREWNQKLTLKNKVKYLQMVERMGLAFALKSNFGLNRKKVSINDILKREPKKPPKNGYSLFTSEQLAKYVNVEPQKRMTEVARIWKQVITQEEKDNFDSRNKLLQAQYQKDLDDFIDTLSPEEREAYEQHRRLKADATKSKTKRSRKLKREGSKP